VARFWRQCFFPLRRWTQVEPLAVKGVLQQTMTQWGRPERIRVDNGMPWGTQSPVPSALALWWVGLDIVPVYGRPARSTDNAVVERSHGVLTAWVEPACCANFADCQAQLTWAMYTQRARYPACGTQTRTQAYPALFANPRPYAVSQEHDLWQLSRVVTYLAQFHFQRKVEKRGQITLFANTYAVGRAYQRQIVEVHLDDQTAQWVVCNDSGQEIRRFPNQELSYDQISQLQLGKRRKSVIT
jgi:hypothetical protein